MRSLPGLRCLLTASLVLASGLPAWSADARAPGAIAFDRTLDGSGRIHVIGPDGRGDRALTPEPGSEAPVWSPDGSQIAWTADRAGSFEIWVMRRDGSRAHRLTRGPGDSHPAWSPDGRDIAFFRAPAGSLEVVSADGKRQRSVGRGRAFDVSAAPAWSPDGRWLAIAGVDGALYMVAADGHAIRRLTPRRPATIAWRPSWSPRGGRVAFLNLAGGALDVVEAGNDRVRVFARQTDELSAPAWSADGRLLAFADGAAHLETIASDGASRRVLTHGVSSDANPAWRPSA